MTSATTAPAARAAGTDQVPVLMYHAISPHSSAAFGTFNVTPETFAAHMQLLADLGCTSLTMSEAWRLRAAAAPLPPRPVVITIDDGFRDFLGAGLPVLQRLGLRATLYVPTGYVGSTSRWLAAEGEDRRPMLSWRDLVEVAAAGVECGAHSHSHPQMDRLDRRRLAREVMLSKTLLEEHLQLPVQSFAYPFGYAGRAAREAVEQAGFDHACIVGDLVNRSSADAFALPRLTVTPEMTPTDLEALLGRHDGFADVARSRLRAVASRALRVAGLKKRGGRVGPPVPSAP